MEFKWSINGFQKVVVCPCMPMYADVCHGHSWHILKTGEAPVSWWLHPHCDWTDSRINKCSSVERVHFLVKIWSCWVCSIYIDLSSWYHHLSHKWKGRSVRSEDRYPFQIVVLCGQLAYVFELGVKRCGAKKSDAAFNNFFDKAWHAKVWKVWRRPTHGWQLPTNNDPWAHGPVQRKLEHVGLWKQQGKTPILGFKRMMWKSPHYQLQFLSWERDMSNICKQCVKMDGRFTGATPSTSCNSRMPPCQLVEPPAWTSPCLRLMVLKRVLIQATNSIQLLNLFIHLESIWMFWFPLYELCKSFWRLKVTRKSSAAPPPKASRTLGPFS